MSNGYSMGQARLAIDEYAENAKKSRYTRSLIEEWEDAIGDARDDSLATGLFGGILGAIFGDSEDMYLGFNIGKEIGYHASFESGAGGDIMENLMNYEDELGNIKFNENEFVETLNTMQDNMEDFVDNEREATMWTVMNNLTTYGEMGGFEEGGPGTQDLTFGERFAFNLKEFFGVDQPLNVPSEFADETAWFDYIMEEMKKGFSLDQILSPAQLHDIFREGRGATIQSLLSPK